MILFGFLKKTNEEKHIKKLNSDNLTNPNILHFLKKHKEKLRHPVYSQSLCSGDLCRVQELAGTGYKMIIINSPPLLFPQWAQMENDCCRIWISDDVLSSKKGCENKRGETNCDLLQQQQPIRQHESMREQ